ncbi:MBL fold metallo-hydrolase [Paenibacillus prosopidis]|uniref:Glyoxylase-like metal-dependent hydrolase (Beta-lactamase superfamily II) n=1 Tax=Paenibacillus prosopidis TaxID=630520 RepID=A0A368W093_9BACL|nr:MBL fold metallo-hydrolase [Paenibacillus prosopidis]RCW47619.1 glyoxylase-like metal-dependent hydrolase (beta-lactamase superfamily II) [Paenibacillus prosopidis]
MRFIREKTVVQLTYLPRLFPVNCYIVEEEDGLTLVDAALPNNVKAIIQASERMGKQITRIVLTHAHDDHIGALDGLKELLPSVQVFISNRDARLLAGDRSLDPNEPNVPIRGGVPKDNKIHTKPDVLLQDGDKIGSLLAVAAPGHTPGSMAFLDTRNDILIAGDAFQTRAGVAVSGQMKLLFPFPAMATWDKMTSLETARRLRDLNPSLLAIGHGNMVLQPKGAIEQAIGEAERALA